jgi:hypothetical protein
MIASLPRIFPTSLLVCLMALGQGAARAEDAPAEITTDSPAYCLQLYERVEHLRLSTTVPPPREVTDLSAEGQKMCDTGLARGGVMRLRRALTIMMHPEEARGAAER